MAEALERVARLSNRAVADAATLHSTAAGRSAAAATRADAAERALADAEAEVARLQVEADAATAARKDAEAKFREVKAEADDVREVLGAKGMDELQRQESELARRRSGGLSAMKDYIS